MCMADLDDDSWDVFAEERRRARKPHRCGECGRDVLPGERYLYAHGLINNGWVTYKMCAQCREAARWLEIICDGWLYTCVREDLEEHLNEVEGDWSLLVLVIGMRNYWRGAQPENVRRLVRASTELYRSRYDREIG